jgi:ketosteroid isomerase-like protein
MDQDQFEHWLQAYGTAWAGKDTDAFVHLFTADCLYFWTPFGEPKRGHYGIGRAFSEAVARQDGIRFGSEVLSVDETGGIAHWWCTFTRKGTGRVVTLDGVLSVKWADGACSEFREWWHSDELT